MSKSVSGPRIEAEFVASIYEPTEFPSLGLPEAAFVGRSNVGKSSFLNALTGHSGSRAVARTSKKPGRTRSVNFYRAGKVAIIDLPGYGYAKVPIEERNRWKNVIESYLQRIEVKLVVLMVDGRTGPTPLDLTMADWVQSRKLSMLVLVTKVDKLGRNVARAVAADVARTLEVAPEAVLATSAVKGEGVMQAWRAIVAMVTAGVDGVVALPVAVAAKVSKPRVPKAPSEVTPVNRTSSRSSTSKPTSVKRKTSAPTRTRRRSTSRS